MSAETSNSTSILAVPGTINILGVEVTLAALILTVIIIVAGFAIAHGVRLFTTKYFSSRLPAETRKNVGRTFYYGIIAVALLSALGVSGLDLSGLFLQEVSPVLSLALPCSRSSPTSSPAYSCTLTSR